MAGVKTFVLLVGVVLVLQCVGNAQAEVTTSNGKNLSYKADLFLYAGVKCVCKTCRKKKKKYVCSCSQNYQAQVECGLRLHKNYFVKPQIASCIVVSSLSFSYLDNSRCSV